VIPEESRTPSPKAHPCATHVVHSKMPATSGNGTTNNNFPREPLTCTGVSCLRRCHLAFVSNPCHFFRSGAGEFRHSRPVVLVGCPRPVVLRHVTALGVPPGPASTAVTATCSSKPHGMAHQIRRRMPTTNPKPKSPSMFGHSHATPHPNRRTVHVTSRRPRLDHLVRVLDDPFADCC
jgi:hypothetical protein